MQTEYSPHQAGALSRPAEIPTESILLPEEALLQRLALGIKRAGLEELVLFVIEAHRPLSGIFSHLAQILTPILPPALGKEYFELLSDRRNLEKLEVLLGEATQ